jgi:tRNA nucleotidyltransferase (CCA-adding enzyme)
MAVKVLRNLRYDNLTIMRVRDLVLYHDAKIGASKKNIRKWLGRIGEETFRDLLKVKEADIKAQNPKYYQHRHNDLVKTGEMLNQIIEAKECFGRKDLAINGSDLMAIGFEQGRELGVFLDELVDLVIANPEMNNREDLLCYSKFIK